MNLPQLNRAQLLSLRQDRKLLGFRVYIGPEAVQRLGLAAGAKVLAIVDQHGRRIAVHPDDRHPEAQTLAAAAGGQLTFDLPRSARVFVGSYAIDIAKNIPDALDWLKRIGAAP